MKLTASRLDLAATCPGAFTLPWTKDTSEAAKNGTAGHAFLERAFAGDVAGALDLLPEHLRGRMSAVDLDGLSGLLHPDPFGEVPFAYNPAKDTARLLTKNAHRDYSDVKPHEIAGTVDVVSPTELAPLVTVLDYKLGQSFVPHPRENLQIKFAAIVAARVYLDGPAHKDKSVTGAVVKIDEDGAARVYSETWDSMDLDAISVEIREVWERVQKQDASKPDLTVGSHCKWCPARTRCPEMVAQTGALIELDARGDELTPDLLRRAWVTVRAMKPLLEKMEARIREEAGHRPIPLGGGKVLRLVETKRESLIVESALEHCDAVGVDPAAVLAAASLSKEGLKRHLGPDAEKLIEACRQSNGVRLNHSESLRECNETRGK